MGLATARPQPFVKLARSIRRHCTAIEDVFHHGLSDARIEAPNTKRRLRTRVVFGFLSHEPLIALARLELGGLYPPSPRWAHDYVTSADRLAPASILHRRLSERDRLDRLRGAASTQSTRRLDAATEHVEPTGGGQ